MNKKLKKVISIFCALILVCAFSISQVKAKSKNTVDVFSYIKKAVYKLDTLQSFDYTVADVYGDGEELYCTIYNGKSKNQYIEVIKNYPMEDGSEETCYKYVKHDNNKWSSVMSEDNYKNKLNEISFENWTTTHQDEYGNAADIPSLGKSGYHAMILYELIDEEKYFADLTNDYVKMHQDEIGDDIEVWTNTFGKNANKFKKACKNGIVTKTKKGKLYTVVMKTKSGIVNFSFNVDKKGRLTSYLVNNVVNYEFYNFK